MIRIQEPIDIKNTTLNFNFITFSEPQEKKTDNNKSYQTVKIKYQDKPLKLLLEDINIKIFDSKDYDYFSVGIDLNDEKYKKNTYRFTNISQNQLHQTIYTTKNIS